MLKVIKNKQINITIENKPLSLPKELRKKIDAFWNEAIKENPQLWNGEIFCVSKCVLDDNSLVMNCSKTDYAHYLYDERIGCPTENSCYNLSAGTLLETLDGYYVIGELAKTTSYPGCLTITGGNIDEKEDIIGNVVNISNTMRREAIEELNIDFNNKEQVLSHEILYLMPPMDKIKGYEFCAKAKINFTSNEIMEYYNKYKEYLEENKLEIEFDKIVLLKKETALEVLKKSLNPKRKYLIPLIEQDSKN